MAGVWSRVLDSLDRHGGAAMVTVAAAFGSTPRDAGARMVVQPDGRFSGTIGGGALEWRAIALAQGFLAGGSRQAALVSIALGPELGQCCGGRVDLAITAWRPGDRDEVCDYAGREGRGEVFATTGRITDGDMTRTLLTPPPDGPAAMVRDGVLTERFGDDPRPILVFGAGHVGRALVLALAPLPFAVTWIDPRPDAFPEYLPANVTAVQQDPAEAALAAAPEGAFVLALTHSHALDLAVVHAALAAERFPYVGVIGSQTKRARFARQLLAAGVSEARVAAMVCPIGMVGIKSKLPAVIAAGTVAELLRRDEQAREAETAPPASLARTG